MNNNLIIGVFSNYNDPNMVLPWVKSALNHSKADVVLIGVNVGPELKSRLIQFEEDNNRFVFIDSSSEDYNNLPRIGMIHMLRFAYLSRFFQIHKNRYNLVVTTDVRDVVFQRDPFTDLDQHLYAYGSSFVASSECIKIGNERWNANNITKCFGTDIFNTIRDQEVLNVGILSGRQDAVAAICSLVYELSLSRKDWVADQAAYNYLLHTSTPLMHSNVYISKLADAYSLNAHVTSKPDQLDQFRPYLTDKPPYFDETDGQIKNNEGVPFAIVHQYDRVPEWALHFRNLYG